MYASFHPKSNRVVKVNLVSRRFIHTLAVYGRLKTKRCKSLCLDKAHSRSNHFKNAYIGSIPISQYHSGHLLCEVKENTIIRPGHLHPLLRGPLHGPLQLHTPLTPSYQKQHRLFYQTRCTSRHTTHLTINLLLVHSLSFCGAAFEKTPQELLW